MLRDEEERREQTAVLRLRDGRAHPTLTNRACEMQLAANQRATGSKRGDSEKEKKKRNDERTWAAKASRRKEERNYTLLAFRAATMSEDEEEGLLPLRCEFLLHRERRLRALVNKICS